LSELENCQAPAGPEDARQLGERCAGVDHVSNAEADGRGIAGPVGERDLGAVPSDEPHRREPVRRHLQRCQSQHLTGKVDADHRGGGLRAQRRHGKITGPGAEVQDARPGLEPELRDRPGPPPRIQAGAEDVIEEVVARRDRVEHPGNPRRGLVDVQLPHRG
jgi:hypothetical protein